MCSKRCNTYLRTKGLCAVALYATKAAGVIRTVFEKMMSVSLGAVILLTMSLVSCSVRQRVSQINSGELEMQLKVVEDVMDSADDSNAGSEDSNSAYESEGENRGDPMIMNAVLDSLSGEMMPVDVISASKVVAKFRNVAERMGWVSISFDIVVPEDLALSQWQLKVHPQLFIEDDTLHLDAVYVTGKKYRDEQHRGYRRYQNFLASIITDSSEFYFLHQLEVFLERNFPDVYAMKTDSSYVSEERAVSLFGLTRMDVIEHYTNYSKLRSNERRKSRMGAMYARFVKDPIVKEGLKLDTVLVAESGDFIYRYVHNFRTRPRLKKVQLGLDGKLYQDGEYLAKVGYGDRLTYYISTLSSLIDTSPRYKTIILERTLLDQVKASLDFRKSEYELDTTMSDNASEMRRVVGFINDEKSWIHFELDSLVISASCSPEGSYRYNSRLASMRSLSLKRFLENYVPQEWVEKMVVRPEPENWNELIIAVECDSLFSNDSKERIMRILLDENSGPDQKERLLKTQKEYEYIVSEIYPKLRTVDFDFYLQRKGMVKDTVHTKELDTLYLSGLKAIKDYEYKEAASILSPYRDYNAALSCLCAQMNHTALSILDNLEEDFRVCYLKSIVFSRLGLMDQASEYFELSVKYNPAMRYRANLDPELMSIVNKKSKNHD